MNHFLQVVNLFLHFGLPLTRGEMTFYKISGRKSNGETVESVTVNKMEDCLGECLFRKYCLTFNTKKMKHEEYLCELISEGRCNTGFTITESYSVFYSSKRCYFELYLIEDPKNDLCVGEMSDVLVLKPAGKCVMFSSNANGVNIRKKINGEEFCITHSLDGGMHILKLSGCSSNAIGADIQYQNEKIMHAGKCVHIKGKDHTIDSQLLLHGCDHHGMATFRKQWK